MGDMGDIFNDMKAHKKGKRKRNLKAADPTGWHQFTPFHWRRKLLGRDLDYWPSTKKWLYNRKYGNGDVMAFISAKERRVADQQAKQEQQAHLERARAYRHPTAVSTE